MIIAYPSCPAPYSVPDAQAARSQVRVTCKHCGGAIIVDASEARDAIDGEVSDADATRVFAQARRA